MGGHSCIRNWRQNVLHSRCHGDAQFQKAGMEVKKREFQRPHLPRSCPPSYVPTTQVFAGAMAALAAMTVLSALLGWAAPNLISKTYTHYAATALFFAFGLRMLYDAAINAGGESELNEVERELQAAHKPPSGGSLENGGSSKRRGGSPAPSQGLPAISTIVAGLHAIFSPVLLEAFTLTFLAEWGDRSQIATIGLAAASDVLGVTLGGVLGHALCTGAAVLGGKHLAAHIDERLVSIFGGILFLIFGLHSLWTGVPA